MARATGYFATFPVQPARSRFTSRWHGARADRKAALRTIFDELQIRRLGDEKAFLRELVRLDVQYHAMRCAWDNSPTIPELRAWLSDLAKCPTQFLEMLSGKASRAGLSTIAKALGISETDLILAFAEDQNGAFKSSLADAAAKAAERARSVKAAGRDRDWPFNALMIGLGQLYERFIGRPAKVGRKNDPYSVHVDGRPTGPFWRFSRSALTLMGNPQGGFRSDEALAKAIQRQRPHIPI
jgi:hypothetical protein